MFIRLLITSTFVIIVVESVFTNSSKGQPPTVPVLPKQSSLDEDYDLIEQTTNAEGSGAAASLDEYADEDEDQLSKVTATTMTTRKSTTTTIKLTTTTTKIPDKKNHTKNNDFDTDEFNEDYKDDLADDVDYNEVTTKVSSTLSPSSTTITTTTVRSTSVVRRPSSIRTLFAFLARPPIAAGILAGLSIGILTSVLLLICLVRRFHRRERTHSSYTTGLLYPNQYGYSKSPQEFYA